MADKYLYNNAGRPAEKEGIQSSAGAGDAGKIPALDAGGRLDITMMPSGVAADVKEAVASEALSAGNFVDLWNDTGTIKARKADATTNGKQADGFVLAAVDQDATATVYLSGINNQLSGLTPGAMQFLHTTAGGRTETAPATTGNLVQQLGIAISATELSFQPQEVCTVA